MTAGDGVGRTPLDLDALEALAAKAADGPWHFEEGAVLDDRDYVPNRVWTDGGTDQFGEAQNDYVLACNIGDDDGRFIAAARTAVPALVERLREVEAENERLLRAIQVALAVGAAS